MFDGFSRREVDIDRVELNDGAGFCGLQMARQPYGKAAFGAPAAGIGALAQGGRRHNHAARDELGDDASDSGVGDGEAFFAQQRPQLVAAPAYRGVIWENPAAAALSPPPKPGTSRAAGPCAACGSRVRRAPASGKGWRAARQPPAPPRSPSARPPSPGASGRGRHAFLPLRYVGTSRQEGVTPSRHCG